MSTREDVGTAMVRLDAIPLDEIDMTPYAHLWNHCLDPIYRLDPGDRAPEEGVAAFGNYV